MGATSTSFSGGSLLLWGGHPSSASPPHAVLSPCTSREGGALSSCLRNALKMRITEHFPNSPQFTFSAFSLGCQAFVVIFINSNRWLLPFLPGTVPPPAGSDVILQLTALQAGLAPVSPDDIFCVSPLCHRRAHPPCHSYVLNATRSVWSQALVLSWLLLSSHKARGLQYGPQAAIIHPWLTCWAAFLALPLPTLGSNVLNSDIA